MTVDDLRREGYVEGVIADRAGALVILDACHRHIASARAIAADDPSGAFQLAYDAARKAINAHMLANGLRAAPGARIGAHVAVGRYADAVLAGQAEEAVRAFDRMRRLRNRTEYGVAHIEPAEVATAIAHAWAIVVAVNNALA